MKNTKPPKQNTKNSPEVFTELKKLEDLQNVNTTNFLCPLVPHGQVYLIFLSSFNTMSSQQTM